MAAKISIPECLAYESCKALEQVRCLRCLHMPIDTWQRCVRKRIAKARKASLEAV